MNYAVTVTETVTYRLLVTADSEEEARERAIEDHQDGLSTEIDNGPVDVESVQILS